MNKKILVSVCIIVYNHAKYLTKAINSVLEQEVDFEFEILIGDDGSTDGSPEIITEFARKNPNIIPVLREKNTGAPYNEFDLASRAKGKYISWLEGDDFWIDKNKLQKQVDFLEHHEEFYSVASRSKVVDENNRIIPYKHYALDEIITPYNYNKIEMPNIGSFTFRNLFLSESDKKKLSEIYFKHSLLTDWTFYLFFVDKSDINVLTPPMHCYRKVINRNADNFNSIYRLKKNKYDVIVERMEYEQALNQFDWKRIDIHYRVSVKAAELWLQILLDHKKDSKAYGKEVYNNKFKSRMTKKERFWLPCGVIKLAWHHLMVKARQFYRWISTKNEMKPIF